MRTRADKIALGRRAHATRRHAAYSRQESSPQGQESKGLYTMDQLNMTDK